MQKDNLDTSCLSIMKKKREKEKEKKKSKLSVSPYLTQRDAGKLGKKEDG